MEKLKLDGENETAAGARPVPLRVTDCGLFAALSVIVKVPLMLPAEVGAKVTLMVQPAPAAKDVPQLSDSANCWLAVMLLMARLTLPGFVRVTD